ncbi:MAG: HK97 family phage prohead protease [Anaerolineae bacterium]|nr:HK97 family phage prohead protease [Anaerolineae bacterium]
MDKEKFIKFGGVVKAIDGRRVTGIAAVFGNVDDGGDRIFPGAFGKTIQEQGQRIKHLWMHNSWDPPTAVIKGLREVGRDDLPDETQEKYPEAMGGLEVTREYLDTERGEEILKGIQAGAITEMSFMYQRVKWDYEEREEGKETIRNLRELRLWETSDVVWGMNAATSASKALDGLGNRLQERYGKSAWLMELLRADVAGLPDEGKRSGLMALLDQFGSVLTAEPPCRDEKALTDELLTELELFTLSLS